MWWKHSLSTKSEGNICNCCLRVGKKIKLLQGHGCDLLHSSGKLMVFLISLVAGPGPAWNEQSTLTSCNTSLGGAVPRGNDPWAELEAFLCCSLFWEGFLWKEIIRNNLQVICEICGNVESYTVCTIIITNRTGIVLLPGLLVVVRPLLWIHRVIIMTIIMIVTGQICWRAARTLSERVPPLWTGACTDTWRSRHTVQFFRQFVIQQ